MNRNLRNFFLINPKTLEWHIGRFPNFEKYYLDYDAGNYFINNDNIDWLNLYNRYWKP